MAPVLSEYSPDSTWTSVVEALDQPHIVPGALDSDGFRVIVDLVQRASKKPFPTELLLRKWKHPEAQWAMLRAALASPEPLITFEASPELVSSADGLTPAPPIGVSNYVQPYLSLNLGTNLSQAYILGRSSLYL